jgi:acyl-CoA thioesterase FadM
MNYRKPLRLFQKFEVVMRLERWDARSFYMTHRFLSRGHVIAEGTSVGVIRGREGVIPPGVVMETLRQLRGAA